MLKSLTQIVSSVMPERIGVGVSSLIRPVPTLWLFLLTSVTMGIFWETLKAFIKNFLNWRPHLFSVNNLAVAASGVTWRFVYRFCSGSVWNRTWSWRWSASSWGHWIKRPMHHLKQQKCGSYTLHISNKLHEVILWPLSSHFHLHAISSRICIQIRRDSI